MNSKLKPWEILTMAAVLLALADAHTNRTKAAASVQERPLLLSQLAAQGNAHLRTVSQQVEGSSAVGQPAHLETSQADRP